MRGDWKDEAMRWEADDRQAQVDFEIQAAAMYQAKRGYTGQAGEPLPDLMSGRACDAINADLPAFQERVRAAAMYLKRQG